ncbi:hypothetical protein MATL_G00245740 [Megalops atlanticus]|uniref:Uncharacterized protein n=1 Tax=Megalops atlanticus TaxID=7932 RepID=A0A9D3PC34_MEGAT|nr:hypothetical protein MATL_G00245740 [Megalops atlanticus]
MEKSSSEESAIHRSPSVDSHDSDFARASTSGRPFGGRGFTAGAFYGSTGPRAQGRAGGGADAGGTGNAEDKSDGKSGAQKGSKYVVFYLDLSFVFLLEFKKFNMARGCLCCLKYAMFLFNLVFWDTSGAVRGSADQESSDYQPKFTPPPNCRGAPAASLSAGRRALSRDEPEVQRSGGRG